MAGIVGIFTSIGEHIPVLKKEKFCEPHPEGLILRAHYRGTTLLVLAMCLLVTSTEWIAGTDAIIDCLVSGNSPVPEKIINSYCYIMGTFSVPRHYVDFDTQLGNHVSQTGVGPYNPREDYTEVKAYYQWVPFMLFLQAIMFYIPHILYKSYEGGKLKAIIFGLNNWIMEDEERHSKEAELATYIRETKGTHTEWCMKLLFAQGLYLVNVIGQIFFTDCFLGYEFSTYGVQIATLLEEAPEQRVDPMSRIFPRVTKCTFRKFGPSGTIQRHDAQCVLPINIINEKIYVFLWFWFCVLTVATIFQYMWTLAIVFTLRARNIIIKRKLWLNPKKDNLKIDVPLIVSSLDFGDWKLVYHLLKNVDALVFAEFCEKLTAQLQEDAARKSGNLSDIIPLEKMGGRGGHNDGDSNANLNDSTDKAPFPDSPSPSRDDEDLLRVGDGNYLQPGNRKESDI